jgi:hypothetical protein
MGARFNLAPLSCRTTISHDRNEQLWLLQGPKELYVLACQSGIKGARLHRGTTRARGQRHSSMDAAHCRDTVVYLTILPEPSAIDCSPRIHRRFLALTNLGLGDTFEQISVVSKSLDYTFACGFQRCGDGCQFRSTKVAGQSRDRLIHYNKTNLIKFVASTVRECFKPDRRHGVLGLGKVS